jgi:hypothetical protein
MTSSGPQVYTVRLSNVDGFAATNALTREARAILAAKAGASGFRQSGENAGPHFEGDRVRATVADGALAGRLFALLKPQLPPVLEQRGGSPWCRDFLGPRVPPGAYEPVGVNDLFRVSRYATGDKNSGTTESPCS